MLRLFAANVCNSGHAEIHLGLLFKYSRIIVQNSINTTGKSFISLFEKEIVNFQ